MRIIITFLFLSICSFGQISLGYDLRGNEIQNYDDGRLQKFKSSETIFIFSNFINKKEMEEVLKKTWTITPFKVVSIEDFDINKYLEGNYSFATYQDYNITFSRNKFKSNTLYDNSKRTVNTSPNTIDKSISNKVSNNEKKSTFYNYSFDFFLIDKELYIDNSIKNKNKYEVLSNHVISVASFLLTTNFPVFFNYFDSPSTFMSDLSEFNKDIYTNLYKEDFLYDNKPGFFLNNFQNINNQLEKEIKISPFEEIKTSQKISSLKTNTLFIPYEVYCYYDINVIYKNKNGYEKLKKNYDFSYSVLTTQEISDKILKGEEFYYLKFNLIETDKILQVVNSKTGEILYSNRFSGMLEQLPNKSIEDLNKEVKKSL